MRKSNIQQLTLAAMVAAVYFVLCYFGNIFQLTFGPVPCARSGAAWGRRWPCCPSCSLPPRRGWHWAAC